MSQNSSCKSSTHSAEGRRGLCLFWLTIVSLALGTVVGTLQVFIFCVLLLLNEWKTECTLNWIKNLSSIQYPQVNKNTKINNPLYFSHLGGEKYTYLSI